MAIVTTTCAVIIVQWLLSGKAVEKACGSMFMLYYENLQLTLSQCRTAVPHCCKGDAVSQWEMAILGVSELRNH